MPLEIRGAHFLIRSAQLVRETRLELALEEAMLLWARRPGDIDRFLHGRQPVGQQQSRRSRCGQCHVVSQRTRLTTDLLNMVHFYHENRQLNTTI